MKILQVITSLLTGGAEKIVVQLTMQLCDRGHEVDVVVFNRVSTPFMEELELRNLQLKEKGEREIKIYKLGSGYYNPLYILKLIKIIRQYDVIHTHNSSPQLFTAIANLFCFKPLITTEHNTTNSKRNNLFWSSVDKWMYGRYDKIICISDQAFENLIHYLPHIEYKTTTVYNGVDINKIINTKGLTKESVSQTAAKKFVILMVAAFRPQKDQDTLIRAIKLLPPEFQIWFAGDGQRKDTVQKLVDTLQLKDKVIFLGNRTDIPELLRTSDAICLSSHYEGLSLSNIEGMSSCKPFIASDVDGLREVTKGYGILFPHENAQALAEIIRKLHDDKAYYDKVAATCYQRALQFDISKMIDAYNNIYSSLCKEKKLSE